MHFYLCKPLEAAVFFECCFSHRREREALARAIASRPSIHQRKLDDGLIQYDPRNRKEMLFK